jgi:hypothetical protein
LLFDEEEEITALVVRFQVGGFSDISFAKGRVLEQLTELVPIAPRSSHRTGTFDDEEAVVGRIEVDLVDCPSRHYQVVSVLEAQLAVHGVQGSTAFVDEDNLVRIGVFEKVVAHALSRSGQDDLTIVVNQHRFTRLQIVVLGLDAEAF